MRNIVLAVWVVVACLGQARAATKTDVIYDGLGGTEKGGDSFATGGTVMLDRVVNTAAGTLKSVVLTVKLGKADLGSFRVVGALAGSGGLPGGLATLATISDRSLKVGKWHNLRVTPTTSLTLKAKTGYFVGIATAPGGKSSIVLGNTDTAEVLARPSVVAGGYIYNKAGLQANSGGVYQVEVETEVEK